MTLKLPKGDGKEHFVGLDRANSFILYTPQNDTLGLNEWLGLNLTRASGQFAAGQQFVEVRQHGLRVRAQVTGLTSSSSKFPAGHQSIHLQGFRDAGMQGYGELRDGLTRRSCGILSVHHSVEFCRLFRCMMVFCTESMG